MSTSPAAASAMAPRAAHTSTGQAGKRTLLARKMGEPLRAAGGEAFALLPLMVRMLSRGSPIRVEEIAAASGQPHANRAALAESLEAAGIEFDAEGNVVSAGLTLVPTQHRFEVEGRALYTWCALDTLIFPILLGGPARVESTCPGTGSTVRLDVTPDGIGMLRPPTAVVSLIAPTASEQVRRAFCDYVHFFASADAAAPWLAEHPDAVVVHAAEAFEIGKVLVSAYLS